MKRSFSSTSLPLSLLGLMGLVSCGPQSQTTSDGTQVTPSPTPMVTINTGTTTETPAVPVGTAPTVVAPMLSPVTQANLDRITKDMSPSEVTAILGQPTSSDSSPIPIVGGTQTTYHYDSGSSSITIVFKNNEMKTKTGSFGNP